jgi:crossover junction endodeoxyribonuclease RuvC
LTALRPGRDSALASSGSTRILGIDPGSIVTGWGIVEANGASLAHLAHGVVTTAKIQEQGARLDWIYRGIEEVIRSYSPDGVCIERVFLASNPQSALKLGQARGVALLAAARHHLAVHEYAAVEIKAAVVGYGHATKQQVQMMIVSLLGLSGPPAADAADALAASICHLHRRSFEARITETMTRSLAPVRRRKSSLR